MTWAEPQRPWYQQPAWWALLVALCVNITIGLWDRARMEQKIEDVDMLVRELLTLELEHHGNTSMPRKPIPLIPNTDLVYPVTQPGFSALVAGDLGGGFTLNDDFDAVMLALTSDVHTSISDLPGLDAIIAAIDTGPGPFTDAAVQPMIDSFAAMQTEGQPLSDGLDVLLGGFGL